MRNPAKVRVYAFTTHCSPTTDNPRTSLIWGSATFTMATSRTTMNWAAQQMANTAPFGNRRRPAVIASIG
jgi:hypothetical protein